MEWWGVGVLCSIADQGVVGFGVELIFSSSNTSASRFLWRVSDDFTSNIRSCIFSFRFWMLLDIVLQFRQGQTHVCQHIFHDSNVCTAGSPHSLSSLELCSQPYTWQISWFLGSYVEEILWRFHGSRSQGLHLVHPRQMPQQWYLYWLRSAEAAVAPLDSFFPLLKSVF